MASPPAPALDGILRPGEAVLWQGRPGKIPILSRGDLVLIPFALLMLAFTVGLWMGFLPSDSPAPPFYYVGMAWLMAWFFLGRYLWRAYLSRNTTYAVTDQRILAVYEILGRWVQHRRKEEGVVEQRLRPDGSGDLAFLGPRLRWWWINFDAQAAFLWPGSTPFLNFLVKSPVLFWALDGPSAAVAAFKEPRGAAVVKTSSGPGSRTQYR